MSDENTLSDRTTDFLSRNLVALGSLLICIMTWGYTFGVKYTQFDLRLQNSEQATKENDTRSASRDAAQQKEIDALNNRQSQTDKTVGEMATKLDVAVAILQRIEKKVENGTYK